jgi:hypothetical protein
MKPTVTMRKALSDPKLLGNALKDESWRPWRILLIAAMGEALTDEERALFTELMSGDLKSFNGAPHGVVVVKSPPLTPSPPFVPSVETTVTRWSGRI